MVNKIQNKRAFFTTAAVAHRYLAVLLLYITFVTPLGITNDESLWFDEAWSVYAVNAPAPQTFEPPRGIRANVTVPLRAAYSDFTTTLARVRDDVHPPLYFMALDAWTFAAGESVFALRYLSLLVGLLGTALMYPLGRRLFGATAGLYALAVYGTTSLFTYYSAEARMYTLLMTLAAASTYAYVRLLHRPNWRRAGGYALLAALGLYTHYAMALVLLAHALHLPLSGARRVWRFWLGAMGAAAVLFAPYVPVVLAQLRANPGGALAASLPTDAATVQALLLLLTGGWWFLYALVLAVVIYAVVTHRARWRGVLLGVLWLLVTPGVLLVVNAVWLPLYQVRYVLGVLPAFALLVGFGLGALANQRWGQWIAPVLAALIVAAQVTSADGLLPPKPDYDGVVAAAATTRHPLEPIITDIAARDPVHYYSRQHMLTRGIALDLAWRDHTAEEIQSLTVGMDNAPAVWMVMPVNVAKTWHTAAALGAQGRAPGYRDAVQNMVIYRFDRTPAAQPLTFTFGTDADTTMATFNGGIATPLAAQAGEQVCVPLALAADAGVGVSVTMVQGYNTVLAQWNGTPADDEACLDVPVSSDPHETHLYLTVYDPVTEARYPVWEQEAWWGWWVVSHTVSITP